MDQAIINFAVYKDGTEYVGIAKATLPDLAFVTQTVSGAGISGNVEAVIPHIDAMTMSLSFLSTGNSNIDLSAPKRHNIDLRVAQRGEDPVAGKLTANGIKHVLVVIPKKDSGGSIAPASTADNSGEYVVRYWATYIDGEKKREIDPINNICYINGTDYLEDVRKALGK